MANKRGRGRLSRIKLLPSKADEVVTWAAQELRREERTQLEILVEFNDKLAEIGLGPISSSAFNRHSIRLADMIRRVNQTREIASVLTEKMEPGQSDDVTITLAEMIKSLISELLDRGGEAGYSPKQAMELAAALKSASSAEKMSSDRQAKLDQKISAKAVQAIDAVSKEAGMSKAQIERMKVAFLGQKK